MNGRKEDVDVRRGKGYNLNAVLAKAEGRTVYLLEVGSDSSDGYRLELGMDRHIDISKDSWLFITKDKGTFFRKLDEGDRQEGNVIDLKETLEKEGYPAEYERMFGECYKRALWERDVIFSKYGVAMQYDVSRVGMVYYYVIEIFFFNKDYFILEGEIKDGAWVSDSVRMIKTDEIPSYIIMDVFEDEIKRSLEGPVKINGEKLKEVFEAHEMLPLIPCVKFVVEE